MLNCCLSSATWHIAGRPISPMGRSTGMVSHIYSLNMRFRFVTLMSKAVFSQSLVDFTKKIAPS